MEADNHSMSSSNNEQEYLSGFDLNMGEYRGQRNSEEDEPAMVHHYVAGHRATHKRGLSELFRDDDGYHHPHHRHHHHHHHEEHNVTYWASMPNYAPSSSAVMRTDHYHHHHHPHHRAVHQASEDFAPPPPVKRVRSLEDDSNDEGKSSAPAAANKQWTIMFERLKEYKAKNGNCLVPKRFPEDPKLGTWVETQRAQYKRLQRNVDENSGVEAVQPNKRLDQERLDKLEAIGFAWSAKGARSKSTGKDLSPVPVPAAVPQPARKPAPKCASAARRTAEDQWESHYQRLVHYKNEHGDCMVPRKYDRDSKLAAWVEAQRVNWNREQRLILAVAKAAETNAKDAVNDFPEFTEDELRQYEGVDWTPMACEATEEDAAEVAAAMLDFDGILSGAVAQGHGPGSPVHQRVMSVINSKKLTKDRKEKLDALGFVWSLRSKRIDDHWDQMFKQLVSYKEKHGDCLVPSRYEENSKLGKWVETQRYEYTKLQRVSTGKDGKEKEEQSEPSEDAKPRAANPRLTQERLRRLEGIGFEWKVRNKMKRYYDKLWQDMFERLMKFKHENGHCIVPKRYPPDMKLGTWVHTQRIQYRKMMNKPLGGGKNGSGSNKSVNSEYDHDMSSLDDSIPKGEDTMAYRLTEERCKQLEEAGFVWSARETSTKADQPTVRVTRNSYDDLWDAMFDRLVSFKHKHGHCLVPKRYQEDPKLGTWVDTQRVQYRKKRKVGGDEKSSADERGSIEPERVSSEDFEDAREVTSAGFPLEVGINLKPPSGRLTDERIQRLEGIGFVWSLRDDWTKHYEELKQYKAEFGNCNVPARYAKNRRLGVWVSAQRQQYKILKSGVVDLDTKKQRPASLTPARIELLNQLGFAWTIRSRDTVAESWNQRFLELKDFKTTYGNCLVPSRFPPNPELGIWVGAQRVNYRQFLRARETKETLTGAAASMSEDRASQLDGIGFIWALRNDEHEMVVPFHAAPGTGPVDYRDDAEPAVYDGQGDADHEMIDPELMDHVDKFVLFLKEIPGSNDEADWGATVDI